jgi:hypothetical protein
MHEKIAMTEVVQWSAYQIMKGQHTGSLVVQILVTWPIFL